MGTFFIGINNWKAGSVLKGKYGQNRPSDFQHIGLPGNEDFSLNSLREARGVEEFFSTSPQQRRLADSDSDNR